MIQFVFGAAAGYVLGTKAGRKRYHQIKTAVSKTVNSPITHSVVNSTRKAVANRLDPEPRMREVKDLNKGKSKRGVSASNEDKIYEVDAN